jgi:hypothetical protein
MLVFLKAIRIFRSDLPAIQQYVAGEWIYVIGDPAGQTVWGPWSDDFTIDIGDGKVWRNETIGYGLGRSGHPVYAKEVGESDTKSSTVPKSWTATFGSLSSSGTQIWVPPNWQPIMFTANAVTFSIYQTAARQGLVKYADVTNLMWDGAPIDFSRYEQPAAGWPPVSGTYLNGIGGGVELWSNVPTLTAGNAVHHNFYHGQPKISDYSSFHVRDRHGIDQDLLRVDGPLQASNHVPASLTWSTAP